MDDPFRVLQKNRLGRRVPKEIKLVVIDGKGVGVDILQPSLGHGSGAVTAKLGLVFGRVAQKLVAAAPAPEIIGGAAHSFVNPLSAFDSLAFGKIGRGIITMYRHGIVQIKEGRPRTAGSGGGLPVLGVGRQR